MADNDERKRSREDLESKAEDLARRYLDLWQDEMTALAAEPLPGAAGQKIVDSCVDLSQAGLAWTEAFVGMTKQAAQGGSPPAAQALMAQGAAMAGQWQDMLQKSWAQAWSGNWPDTAPARAQEAGGTSPHSSGDSKEEAPDHDTTGTAPSATAPERGSRDLDELTRRLALLEKRLAAYEAGSENKGGGSGG
ncbi:hypothetical protein ACTL6U_16905 [Rhodovibrionaceae bacterium A322]